MKAIIERIEIDKLPLKEDLTRLGFAPDSVVRIILETVDDDDISITEMNAKGKGFDHLADEPDLYTDADLIERD